MGHKDKPTSLAISTASFPNIKPQYATEEEALQDYNGNSNTTKIIASYGAGTTTSLGAGWCRSKTIKFKNKTLKGYIPALGE